MDQDACQNTTHGISLLGKLQLGHSLVSKETGVQYDMQGPIDDITAQALK